MSRGMLGSVILGGLLVAMVGCTKRQIEMPPQQVDTSAWDQRIKNLEDRLAAAEGERDRLRDRIRQLEGENAGLRQQLAQKPEPAPAPGWQNVPGGAMTSIEGTVLFDSGKATFKPGARETLDQVAQVIADKYPDYDVYVYGYTDNVPIQYSPWKDNLELSVQRGLTVTRYMRDALRSDDVAAGGWGAARPVADNNTAEGRQQNRRVQIYAMRPEEGAEEGEPRTSPPHGMAPPRANTGETAAPAATPRTAPPRTVTPGAAPAAPRTAPRTAP